MSDFSPSDLKSILHSKRANMYYLQHCRVVVKGGRVEYITTEGKQSQYWNIPIANTTSILLGTGTSVTQAAMRELARAGVLVGFCGGGTPLFSCNDVELEVAWFNPQSEYRPCKYLQQWLNLWPYDSKRLQAAKAIQQFRIDFTLKHWLKNKTFIENSFVVDESLLNSALSRFKQDVDAAGASQPLMLAEARLTKLLYRIACNTLANGDSFTRAKGGNGIDPAPLQLISRNSRFNHSATTGDYCAKHIAGSINCDAFRIGAIWIRADYAADEVLWSAFAQATDTYTMPPPRVLQIASKLRFRVCNIDSVVIGYIDSAGTTKFGELLYIVTLLIENLQAVIASVTDN